MARPIKTFTPDEAMSLIRTFWLKSRDLAWDNFQKNLLINPVLSADAKREQLTKTSAAAKLALDVLLNANDKEASPATLRLWIDTYLSPEGWRRIQAAQRQKKSTHSNRDLLTKINKDASRGFSFLAKEAGLSKKDYLSALAGWMRNDEAGQQAAAAFAARLKTLT